MSSNRFLREATQSRRRVIETADQASAVLKAENSKKDSLVESWAKTEVGTKKLIDLFESNPAKARYIATALTRQDEYNKTILNLHEDTQISQDFRGMTPTNLLKVCMIGTANSNRGNIFKEQALLTMNDYLIYVFSQIGRTVRGAVKGQTVFENFNTDYASATQSFEFPAAASTTFYAPAVLPAPIVRLRMMVVLNGALIGSDDGNGTFNSTLANFDGAASTVNYDIGEVSLTFTNALTLDDVVSLQWVWDAEKLENYDEWGQAQIKIVNKRFNPTLYPLNYSFSTIAAQTLGSTGVGNMNDMLLKQIGFMHAARKDHQAISLAKKIAASQPEFTFNANYAAQGSLSDQMHVQRITETLKNVGGAIYNEIQRGGVTAMVAGTKAAAYLSKHEKYSEDMSQSRVSGTYLDGKLNGVPIYVCPSSPGLVDQDQILCIYKNPDEDGEPSLVFGTFTELSASLEYPDFRTDGSVATVEDRVIIQPKYIKSLRLLENQG